MIGKIGTTVYNPYIPPTGILFEARSTIQQTFTTLTTPVEITIGNGYSPYELAAPHFVMDGNAIKNILPTNYGLAYRLIISGLVQPGLADESTKIEVYKNGTIYPRGTIAVNTSKVTTPVSFSKAFSMSIAENDLVTFKISTSASATVELADINVYLEYITYLP